ncbi:DUF6430 domain-containing protein [Thermoanaerobacterium thermosaccharolyticum]|uniref:macro domain-containing protein n=1 Tax=Thermoanaerobacterium thermosaccharolyticum TaxID=1517 RepID=UPI003D294CD9
MFSIKSVPKVWKDSAMFSSAIFAVIATFMGVAGISLDNIISNQKWWIRLLVILAMYAFLLVILRAILNLTIKNGITIKIRGISVSIKQGNIFDASGWKVIPFNEYFDTTVNDKIISSTSLNGIFIKNYVKDLKKLRDTIMSANENDSDLKKYKKDNRFAYPLGRIITFEDYMLLAFSHFNQQNIASISKSEYVCCLLTMWKEIRRTYANKPVFLPLIGSGITSFVDISEKSNLNLLKCMLYTLWESSEYINQPITILLTKEVMQEINIYEMKGVI